MNERAPLSASSSVLVKWTQNAAIFAVCANLVSTAFANIGIAVFLLLFLAVCLSDARRQLATENFPRGFALALAVYLGWQVIGLLYTDAPMSYALTTLYSERKIVLVLPLVLIFSDAQPKRRFLKAFLATAATGLVASFALTSPMVQELSRLLPIRSVRAVTPLIAENVFRSNVTQGMVFALAAFLAFWLSLQPRPSAGTWALRALAAAFTLNIAVVTHGRSGYVVFLVLVAWAFAMWRGWRGLVAGSFAAVLVAVFAFYASPSVQQRVMQGVNEARAFATVPLETSLGKRMVLYETTLELIKQNPAFGLGTGAFKKHYSALAAEKYQGWQSDPADDPHNQYLFVTAENGLIGLASFFLLIGAMLWHCLKDGNPYGKLAAGCVLAWCATSLFSGHFRTFPEGHLIAFIVGMLMVSRSSSAPGLHG